MTVLDRRQRTLLRALGLRLRLLAALLAGVAVPLAGVVASGQTPTVSPLSVSAQTLASIAAIPVFSISDAVGAERLTHLAVGRTLALASRDRVSRIYVGNPAVIDSYTVTPRQILLTAKTPGVSSLILWDENGKTQTYTVSVDVDLDQLRSSLQHALPTEPVAVLAQEDKVILTGTVSTRAAADQAVKLASLFGKDVVDSLVVNSAQGRQVELKVRFIEVDRSRLRQYGVNLFGPSGSSVGASTTSQFPSSLGLGSTSTSGSVFQAGGNTLTVTDPLNFTFFSSKLGVGLTLEDLENRDLAQILAEPSITTLSGQPASFLAGGEFPFPVVQGSSTGTTSITVQFQPYGVKLEFTPKVNVDGTIDLKVVPEVSALDFTNAVEISGYTIPALSTKRANTEVVLRSGQSFAISGLLDKQTTDELMHTPGFASIPILGALFKSKGVNLSTTELIVIVTPTIVDPLTQTSRPVEVATPRQFLDSQKFDKSIPGAGKPQSSNPQ